MPDNYTVNWTAPHAQLWQQVLGKFKGQPNINALELGTYEGRSACWFASQILTGENSHLTCVDPWVSERLADVAAAEGRFDTNVAAFGDRIYKVKSPSVPFLLNRAAGGIRYHWIYVDGDHRGFACLTDMVLAWQLLHPEGVMIVDDTGELYSDHFRTTSHYPPPRVAANAFLSSFQYKYKLLHNGDQVVVEKLVVDTVPFATRP